MSQSESPFTSIGRIFFAQFSASTKILDAIIRSSAYWMKIMKGRKVRMTWIPFKVMALGLILALFTSSAAYISSPSSTEEKALADVHVLIQLFFVFWNSLYLVPVFWIVLALSNTILYLGGRFRTAACLIFIAVSFAAFILILPNSPGNALFVRWGALGVGLVFLGEWLIPIMKRRNDDAPVSGH